MYQVLYIVVFFVSALTLYQQYHLMAMDKNVKQLQKDLLRAIKYNEYLEKLNLKFQQELHWYKEQAKLCTCGIFKKEKVS